MKINHAVLVEERMLKIKEVCQMVSLSRSTIWRLERAGNFPKHRYLSPGRVGWKLTEIQNWIDDRQYVGAAA